MSEEQQYNAGDRRHVAQAAKTFKREHDQAREDMRAVLLTEAGRRVIWRLLEECGIYRSSFSSSGSQTFFNEGQRNAGLRLQAQVIEANQSAYLQMLKENQTNV